MPKYVLFCFNVFFASMFSCFCTNSYQKVRNIMCFSSIDLFFFDSALSMAKIKGNHCSKHILIKFVAFAFLHKISFLLDMSIKKHDICIFLVYLQCF